MMFLAVMDDDDDDEAQVWSSEENILFLTFDCAEAAEVMLWSMGGGGGGHSAVLLLPTMQTQRSLCAVQGFFTQVRLRSSGGTKLCSSRTGSMSTGSIWFSLNARCMMGLEPAVLPCASRTQLPL